MALNFLHPNALKFTYTVGDASHVALTHTQLLPCEVVSGGEIGADPSTVLLATRDGGTVDMVSACENYMGAVDVCFNTDAGFQSWELFSYPPDSNDGTWLTAYTPTIVTGGVIAVGDSRWTRQTIYTFRTYEGGIAKIVLMEGAFGYDEQLAYAALDPSEQLFIDYLVSNDSWIKGRDGGHLLSFIRSSGGQNEKTWRQRFRP